MNRHTKRVMILIGFLLALARPAPSRAQSADALIDKLVEKGILTVKEANQLREESDQGFTKGFQVKTGMPDWVNSFRIGGDLRLRYDGLYFDEPTVFERHRWRYRLRLGFTAVLKDNLEVGLRLMSGEGTTTAGSDPISGNTSFQDNGSKKQIFIDLAYGKWTPLRQGPWVATLTAGKMENPFVFSDLVFDPDYTPEGLAEQVSFAINSNHSLKLNLGQFVLDELRADSNDPFMLGGQVRVDSTWGKRIATSAGLSALAIANRTNLITGAVPDQNKGNARDGTGIPLRNFNPIIVDAAVTYTADKFPFYKGVFPIRLGGEYLNNPAAPRDNVGYSLGITFGKSGKKGTWDIGYRYKVLEADAWYEELVDSDQGALYFAAPIGGAAGYGPGTNIRGHGFRASYSPYDSLTLAVTYYDYELIHESPPGSKSGTGRVQVDAIWKF